MDASERTQADPAASRRGKRAEALVPLSHDHHEALVAGMRLRRAAEATADAERAVFLHFWRERCAPHFRAEEEVLLPAFATYGDPYDPVVLRVLGDHVAIRERAARLERASATPAALHELGELLTAHVRLEERELFPLVERTLPPDAMAALAAALGEAEAEADHA
jgi:hypothetical protein